MYLSYFYYIYTSFLNSSYKIVTPLPSPPYNIPYKGNTLKIKFKEAKVWDVVIMEKFFGSLFFSYFYFVDVVIEAVVTKHQHLLAANLFNKKSKRKEGLVCKKTEVVDAVSDLVMIAAGL